MPGASSDIIINVPPKVIYDIASDFENYPEFLPDVKSVVVEKSGKNPVVTFEISVIKRIYYTLQFTLVPGKKISWTYVKGDLFKDNQGGWEFEAVGKGQTKVTYHVDVEFGIPVPSLITRKLVGSNLPSMLKRFKERAESF